MAKIDMGHLANDGPLLYVCTCPHSLEQGIQRWLDPRAWALHLVGITQLGTLYYTTNSPIRYCLHFTKEKLRLRLPCKGSQGYSVRPEFGHLAPSP